MEGLLVRIAKCCNPVPGDEIEGYITRGRGVSVHRSDCHNLEQLKDKEPERIIGVEWQVEEKTSYTVELEIEALDKQALLNDLTRVVSDAGLNITSANVRTTKEKLAYINLSLEISSLEHMQAIMTKLEDVDGVLNVQRANPS